MIADCQDEIDHLFKAIVLPKIMYGLPVYGACRAILNTVQCFLERRFKRRYSSKLYNINELLEKCDRKLFNKINSDSSHPLYPMLPQAKASSLRLRRSTSQFPKIDTERFKSSFFHRLNFRSFRKAFCLFSLFVCFFFW